MCGIVLEISRRSPYPDNGYPFYNELKEIEHRGKDDMQIHEYKTVKVGFRRLAITDRYETPTFPGWMVYLNGEIYNYKELGYEGCELDVLSQGFKEHGADFVKKLNGMFFIVAFDEKENIFVFRDRYGIKPVYVWGDDEFIMFTSEIKSILQHPNYTIEVNNDTLQQWFTFNNSFTGDTMFKNIRVFEKGSYLNCTTFDKIKYWEWNFKPTPMDYDFAVSEVQRLVKQAIQRQIPNEVKYTGCISGGVDSNIIASQLPRGVLFYTVKFRGQDNENTSITNKPVYEIWFNSRHHLGSTIFHLEDLKVGASWSNYGMFKQMAAHGNKVCFDGSGADELFGGYPWRYSIEDYFDILNRTGNTTIKSKEVFKEKFPVDTFEERFKFDAEHFLEGVLLVGDKLSMAHTIELRVPFLDNDLVDFALTLPNEFKENKKILKDAFRGIVNEDILNGKKRGFSSPDWFEGEGNQANKWANAAYTEWKHQFLKHQ